MYVVEGGRLFLEYIRVIKNNIINVRADLVGYILYTIGRGRLFLEYFRVINNNIINDEGDRCRLLSMHCI